jgi:hypothetical protein
MKDILLDMLPTPCTPPYFTSAFDSAYMLYLFLIASIQWNGIQWTAVCPPPAAPGDHSGGRGGLLPGAGRGGAARGSGALLGAARAHRLDEHGTHLPGK